MDKQTRPFIRLYVRWRWTHIHSRAKKSHSDILVQQTFAKNPLVSCHVQRRDKQHVLRNRQRTFSVISIWKFAGNDPLPQKSTWGTFLSPTLSYSSAATKCQTPSKTQTDGRLFVRTSVRFCLRWSLTLTVRVRRLQTNALRLIKIKQRQSGENFIDHNTVFFTIFILHNIVWWYWI